MSISGADATTIATHLKKRAGAAVGADDTATVALWIRSRWGGTGSDAAVIAAYASARGDTDLAKTADHVKKHG